MATTYKYRLWCEDESAWVTWLIAEGEPTPTTCPKNTAHTIDTTKTCIVEVYSDQPVFDTSGHMKIRPEKPTEPRANIISPNFCDPLTWHTKSVRVEGEELEANHDRTRFFAQHHRWVDLNHGRVSDEDSISSGKLPVIYVDDEVQTEVSPFTCLDSLPNGNWPGDYVVHHEHGIVEFNEAVPEGAVVTADYSYVTTSEWIMAPNEGTILSMVGSEVQFSENVVLMDTIRFSVWGIADYFLPPEMIGNEEGQIPSGTKIQLEDKVYKTMGDFINEANGAYPTIPQIGGPVRGTSSPILEIPWVYRTAINLYHSKGMEVRVSLEHDIPCRGDMGTIAFYCVSLAEGS